MDLIMETLKIMGVGMGTVFAVIVIFILLIQGLMALFPYKE